MYWMYVILYIQLCRRHHLYSGSRTEDVLNNLLCCQVEAVWVQKPWSDEFVLENPARWEHGKHSSYLNLPPLFTGRELFSLYWNAIWNFMFSFFIRQRVIALTPALREILQIKAEEKTRPIEFNPSAFLDSRLTRKLRVNGAFAFCNCFPGSFVFIFYFMIRSRAIFMAYSNFTHIELLDFPCNVI